MPPTGSQNAIMGDEGYGLDIPQTQVGQQDLKTERSAARFSKTKEYKELKAHCESRIAYYQTYLPGAIPAENVPDEERGKYWAIANMVIGEFQALLNAYEQAAQVIKEDATPQQKRT